MSDTLTRRRSFAQLPDALVLDTRLSAHAVRLWARLDKYAGQDGNAFPSRQRLADDIGVSLGTVKRALTELTQTGWITRTPRDDGRSWLTTLNDAPGSRVSRTRLTGEPTPGSPVSRIRRPKEGHPPTPAAGHHPHDGNARRALTRRRDESQLPMPVDELLSHAYRVGHGDPWEGYLALVPELTHTLDGARDPALVLRSRLDRIH